jgi:beta-glucanase (GH16 family)
MAVLTLSELYVHNQNNFMRFGITLRRTLIVLFMMAPFVQCSEGGDDKNPPPVVEEEEEEEEPTIPAIATAICDFELNETTLTSAGWTKTFEDDFSTDLSKWNIWTGGAFNNELQYYQAANLQVTDGKLIITAKKETVSGATHPWDATQKSFDFTSGRIESKTNISASTATPKVRIVARIKLPAGKGMWGAFWSYGDPWPTQGEIDFIETRGNEGTKYHTNYFYGTSANNNLVSGAEGHITADSDLTECYHVYELIWEKSKLTSYLDGNAVEIKKSGGYISSMFDKQQRITLNLAVGGNFFTGLDPNEIETGSMTVDWVKVFTHP